MDMAPTFHRNGDFSNSCLFEPTGRGQNGGTQTVLSLVRFLPFRTDQQGLKGQDLKSMYSPPSISLYQYMPGSAFGAIRQKRLLISSPASVNDPFEWSPSVQHSFTSDGLKAVYDPSGPPWSTQVNFELSNFSRSEAFAYQESFPTVAAREFGLICLGEESRSPLMWAHYANGHRGFVVRFQADQLHSHAPGTRFLQVSYNYNRPQIRHPREGKPSDDELAEIFRIKSPDWACEKEWRMLVPVAQLQSDLLNGLPRLFLPIPGSAFREIIFGIRCPEEMKIAIRKTCLADPDLQHVIFNQACASSDSFYVVVVPYRT